MPEANAHDIAPNLPMSISEACAATGISSRKITRLIDDEVLPKSVCLKRGKAWALRAYSMPMAVFCAYYRAVFDKRIQYIVTSLVGNFAKKNWKSLLEDPRKSLGLRYDAELISVDLGKPVLQAMLGLNRLIDARSRVVEDPEIRGGIPTIRGTRIGVYQLAGLRENEDMETILEHYPWLSREDVDAAALYAKAYPKSCRKRLTPLQRLKYYPGARLVSHTVMELPRRDKMAGMREILD